MSKICNKQQHFGFQGALKQARIMKEKTGMEFTVYYCAQHNSYHCTKKKSNKLIKGPR